MGEVSSKALIIPSLDGIRALSFLVVYVAHAGFGDVVPGGFGVTVFFFLSGYLISTLLRLEWQRTGKIDIPAFFLRRVLRILPPFYIVLVAAVLLALFGVVNIAQPPLSVRPILAQVFHVSNYWIVYNGTDQFPYGTVVYWSLAVEEHFYIVYPALFVFLYRRFNSPRNRVTLLFGICALVLVWRLILVHQLDASVDRTYMSTDTRVDSILWGCALALWGNPVLDKSRISASVWANLMLPVALLVLVFTFVYRDDSFRETWRYTLQSIALIPLFVVSISNSKHPLFHFLNYGFIKWLGTLSFTLYLVHQIVLGIVSKYFGNRLVMVFLISLIVSLVLAILIHQLVERPCAQLRRRLSSA